MDVGGGIENQVADEANSFEGTAFRPYIKSVISRALAPEGTFSSGVGGPQRLKPIHLGT
jgi:hypothetical protein